MSPNSNPCVGGPGTYQGLLEGCEAGQGRVRWDTVQLWASTTFKCTGSDPAKAVTTEHRTAGLLADFYRAGDGEDESLSCCTQE
jgi:hypothetical protein